MPALLPERLEAGTLATPAIATLGAGAKFLLREGMEAVSERLRMLTKRTHERLREIPKLHLIGENGFAIASFTMENAPASAIAEFLDTRGICVRAGLHCAPLIHEKNHTATEGTVRVSLSYLNKTRDLDRLYHALLEFTKLYN
jgi:selenocysteine lyase/cysteine desulfurase